MSVQLLAAPLETLESTVLGSRPDLTAKTMASQVLIVAEATRI